jgi:hypothetical protein
MQQSISAITRGFQFPLHHAVDKPVGIPEEGHGVVEFVHDLKRFMTDRQQILCILNAERRSYN